MSDSKNLREIIETLQRAHKRLEDENVAFRRLLRELLERKVLPADTEEQIRTLLDGGDHVH